MSALIWCPFPDQESARRVASGLLDRDLVACVNLFNGIESIFKWNDERGTAQEIGVLFKTSSACLEKAIQCLAELHPYDTPAILGWSCDSVHPDTADWLNALGRGNQ